MGGILFDLYKGNDTNGFNWDVVGNGKIGRNNLGDYVPTFIYQLLQFSVRAELEKELGKEKAISFIRNAGKTAGLEYAIHTLDLTLSFDEFMAALQHSFVENKIGILKVEEVSKDLSEFVITISEDLDCSYLPMKGENVCNFDEGFIAGILGGYTKKEYQVREIDCWVTSARVCRFKAVVEGE